MRSTLHTRLILLTTLLCAACSSEPNNGRSFGGGTPDTCTDAPENVTEIMIEATDQLSGLVVLKMTWDRPTTGVASMLSPAYFETPQIERAVITSDHRANADDGSAPPSSKVRVEISDATEAGVTLAITNPDEVLVEGVGHVLDVTLEYPDRRIYSDCTHGGMPDRYMIDVKVAYDESGALLSVESAQSFVLGDY